MKATTKRSIFACLGAAHIFAADLAVRAEDREPAPQPGEEYIRFLESNGLRAATEAPLGRARVRSRASSSAVRH